MHKIILATYLLILIPYLLLAQDDSQLVKIGIQPFRYTGNLQTGEWVSRGIEFSIAQQISNVAGFQVYDRERLKNALAEHGYPSQPISDRMVYHLGKSTDLAVLISGNYTVAGDELIVQVVFRNTFDGSVVLDARYTRPLSELFEVSKDIVKRLLIMFQHDLDETEQSENHLLTNSILAYKYFIQGYIASESPAQTFQMSEQNFQAAVNEDGQFWQAHYNLGITYFNNNLYDKAFEQFNSIIQMQPEFDKPYYGLGLISSNNGDSEKAIKHFQKAIELNQQNYLAHYYLARVYRELAKTKPAKEHLQKAISINPDYAPNYIELGNAYFDESDYSESVTQYKSAVKLEPDNADYHISLGQGYYYSRAFYYAYDEFKEATELNPTDPNAFFLFGITAYKQAVISELIEAFIDIFDADPNAKGKVENKFSKKITLDPVKQHQVYTEMAGAFSKAVQLNPSFTEATFNLALTYHEMGMPDSAEYFYKIVQQLKPDLVRSYRRLAELYTTEDRKSDAVNEYRKLFLTDPGTIMTQPTLGAEHQYLNIYELFWDELNNDLQVKPDDPDKNLVLAKIYQARGEQGRARELASKIVTSNPNYQPATEFLKSLKE